MCQDKTNQPPKVKVINLRKQIGDKDCGVLVIAFTTSLAFDYKALSIKCDQNKMRRHLANCFKGQKSTIFPN